MHPLRNILGKFVKDCGIEGGVTLNAVRKQWVKTVGETVSVHTYPDTVKGGKLTIIVDTPQWMHHLSFYKDDISSKLNHFGIKGIHFRLGRIPSNTVENTPRMDTELSDEDIRYIENTVHDIKDDELKDTFRKLIRHGLARGKKR